MLMVGPAVPCRPSPVPSSLPLLPVSQAAFVIFSFVVGATLLPAALLPMEVLASPAAGGAAASRDGAADRLSSQCGDKLEGKEGGVEAEGSLLSVHVSAGSQARLQAPAPGAAPGGGGLPDSQLSPSWRIGAGLDKAAEGGDVATIGIVADCRSSSARHQPEADALASPQRPLLAHAHDPASPVSLPATQPARAVGRHTSTLEIAGATRAGSKTRMPAVVASPGAAPAPEASVWQGVKALLCDVNVAVFLFLAFLMGIGNGVNG